MPNPQAGGPPLVGCPRLLIQHICSCSPYLEGVSSIRNLRRRYAVVKKDPPNMDTFIIIIIIIIIIIMNVHIEEFLNSFERDEFLTAVIMKSCVFWDKTPCILVEIYRCFVNPVNPPLGSHEKLI
jgi:hypothetical protein